MRVRIGDPVRLRTAPDVDPSLWDREGLVAAFTRDDQLVIELEDGADVTVLPDHVDRVEHVDVAAAFRGTTIGPF